MKGLQREHVRGAGDALDIALRGKTIIYTYIGTICTTAEVNRARYQCVSSGRLLTWMLFDDFFFFLLFLLFLCVSLPSIFSFFSFYPFRSFSAPRSIPLEQVAWCDQAMPCEALHL